MVKQRCVDCGVLFEPQSVGATRCFSCFNLKRYKDSQNANFRNETRRDGISLPQLSVLLARTEESNHPGFSDEAGLLEDCWRRVQKFEPVPTQAQAASLAATLFISLSRR